MVHAAILAVRGRLLFHTWREARALWDMINARVRHKALVLMPDHLHALLAREEQFEALARAMRAYAQWRNARRGETGAVFEHGARPTPVRGAEHAERTRRYIHLNPCRARLVEDPLAWPFSTHRDLVGLALPAVVPAVAQPARFHAYVSEDPAAHVAGTPWPEARGRGAPAPADVRAAVSALTRRTAHDLECAGPARDLLILAARQLSPPCPQAATAALLGVSEATVSRHARRAGAANDAAVALVARVAGDARFPLLTDEDLRRTPAWRAYRHLR